MTESLSMILEPKIMFTNGSMHMEVTQTANGYRSVEFDKPSER